MPSPSSPRAVPWLAAPAARALGEWLTLGSVVGVLCGASAALFLGLLDLATATREGHEVLIYFLPVCGLLMGWLLERLGESARAGNNLVIDTLHDGGPELPLRMAPTVLVGSVLTHLFGGSAGREGTAVQMGASLTDWLSHRLRVRRHTRLQLLAAGAAGGFGAVFGTPVAGAIFGLEFVVLGRIEYGALVPALVAAFVGDFTTRALGIVHTHYPEPAPLELTPLLGLKWLVFAGVIALCAVAFIEGTHALKSKLERAVPRLPWRMALGGAVVVVLWRLLGTSAYLGLGVPGILAAFSDVAQPMYAFSAKLVFTAVTLASGFLGGEVTPLFFIGATLGNTLAQLLDLPLALGAGVGLAALFAAAANTPLALAVMAAELLGAAVLPHAMLVCVLAYLFTGHRSIYPAQRLLRAKHGQELDAVRTLRER